MVCFVAGYGRTLSGRLQLFPKGLMQTSQGSTAPTTGQSLAQESAGDFDLEEDFVKLDKSNIILLGPTGCGEWGEWSPVSKGGWDSGMVGVSSIGEEGVSSIGEEEAWWVCPQ